MTSRTAPVAFLIDQSRIDGPAFPRAAEWWRRFLPMWVNLVEERPDGLIYLAVERRRGEPLARFLATTARGRLAAAAAAAAPPDAVPPSPWDDWYAAWTKERVA